MAITTFQGGWANTQSASIKLLHDALLAVGLVQTSDTGQLNLAANPTNQPTSAANYGYTTYRWPDAYQATYPIFLRIDWKNSFETTPSWVILAPLFTLGEGLDGAGTLTGRTIVSSITWTSSSAVNSATVETIPNYVGFKDGSLTIALVPTAATTAQRQRRLITVSRLAALDGSPVPGIWTTQAASSNGGVSVSPMASTVILSPAHLTNSVFNHATFASTTNCPPVSIPYAWWAEGASLAVGGQLPFFTPSFLDPAGRTVLGEIYTSAPDTPFPTLVTVGRLGQQRTYLPFGQQFALAGSAMNGICGAGRIGFTALWEA